MFLYFGMNYKNKETIRSSTVTQYSVAINALFTLRSFKPPIEPSNPNNLGGIIIINCTCPLLGLINCFGSM